jgi:hypothetical protein
MKKLLIGVAALTGVALAHEAFAQTAPQKVGINNTAFAWSWTPGVNPGVDDGAAEYFKIYCGKEPGNYTLVPFTVANPLARQQDLKPVIQASGAYYCAIAAGNSFGESGKSNEIFFDAGVLPSQAKTFGLIKK